VAFRQELRSSTGIVNNKRQALIGLAAILLGVLVYLTDRPPWQTPWFSGHFSLYRLNLRVFGHLGNNLPSFFHVFGLSVLTAGIAARGAKSYAFACGLWLVVDFSFELLQSITVQNMFPLICGSHGQITGLLMRIQSYSLNGVFDLRDLLAATFGAVCAYCLLLPTQGKEEAND
jgi:hypothetical protein